MEKLILLIIFLVALAFFYSYRQNPENFVVPSSVNLTATSQDTMIKLFWTRPNTNYEDIYSYLIYLGEPNKDVTMFTIKSEPNKLFYTKRFDNLDPTIKYKIKVRAVSNNGISADSNIVEIQPMNKNQVPGRPSNPFVNKITCLPDGTYKTAATCIKSVFPTVDDMSEHNNLMDKLSAQKKESFLNL